MRRQARQKAVSERPLVPEHRLPAERVHVLDGGDESGEELVLARPQLEAVSHGLVRGRTHLVGAPRFE